MGNIEFAWDARKAQSNLRKHGISFEEARAVFLDDNARIIEDPDHSTKEERFLLLGYSFRGRCVVVVHCYFKNDSTIRLISARRATRREEKVYWSFR